MAIKVCYTTPWKNQQYILPMTFESREDYDRWQVQENRIKETSRDINREMENGAGGDRLKSLLMPWIYMVIHMEQTFGADKIPVDIRSAVSDAEEILCFKPHDFGEDCGFYVSSNKFVGGQQVHYRFF